MYVYLLYYSLLTTHTYHELLGNTNARHVNTKHNSKFTCDTYMYTIQNALFTEADAIE